MRSGGVVFELNQWIHGSSFLFPRCVDSAIAGPEEAKNLAGKSPPPDSDPFSDAEFGKNRANCQTQFAASANRRFQFQKRGQLFIRAHNETLSVVAMRVCNPDRSPASMIPLPKCRTIRHNSPMTPLFSGDCEES